MNPIKSLTELPKNMVSGIRYQNQVGVRCQVSGVRTQRLRNSGIEEIKFGGNDNPPRRDLKKAN
jgi:hypothetical protein